MSCTTTLLCLSPKFFCDTTGVICSGAAIDQTRNVDVIIDLISYFSVRRYSSEWSSPELKQLCAIKRLKITRKKICAYFTQLLAKTCRGLILGGNIFNRFESSWEKFRCTLIGVRDFFDGRMVETTKHLRWGYPVRSFGWTTGTQVVRHTPDLTGGWFLIWLCVVCHIFYFLSL